jgi:nitrile hydratase subunit beta
MNGVHDMGGTHGHGAIVVGESEPIFHADWERKVWAMMRVCLHRGLFNLDEMRNAIERMEPARYLSATYYERWLAALETLVREKGVAGDGPVRPSGRNPRRDVEPAPRFEPGARVRTRNLHRRGHNRLPGYARARRGVVEGVYPPALLPDTNADLASRDWEPVYLVTFDSRELWGDQGRDGESVSLSLFESYLQPEDA